MNAETAPPDRHGQPEAPGGERQVPFYCPYCGDEDLRPAGPAGGGWRCGSCARGFELRFAGITPAALPDEGAQRP